MLFDSPEEILFNFANLSAIASLGSAKEKLDEEVSHG